MSAATGTAASGETAFVWDRSYDNYEQVRPYFADYLAVRESLDGYPYNDSFKGRIPAIIGPDEDTAIYMLQSMHSRDEMAAKVAAFIAEGGVELSEIPVGVTIRADVVTYGFYVGGTGFTRRVNGRFAYYGDKRGSTFIPKGKRYGIRLDSANVLVLPL